MSRLVVPWSVLRLNPFDTQTATLPEKGKRRMRFHLPFVDWKGENNQLVVVGEHNEHNDTLEDGP